MGKGSNNSNDLNLLLKTQVIKLRAELDIKGSLPTIKKQVDIISELLKDKPVKLKVQLDYKLTELRSQLKILETTLFNAKSIKPLKIGVEIDVKGSADAIKKQLKDVYETVENFNKNYGKQLDEMRKKTEEAKQVSSGRTSKPSKVKPDATDTNAPLGSFDTKIYAQQLREAEKQMRQTFGKKGLFSSHEFKDADGNLQGFIARLTKANGVVQQFRYNWDKEKESFLVVDQQTINDSQKSLHKARQSLNNLRADIEKLSKGKGKDGLTAEWERLNKFAKNGILNNDHIVSLRNAIKEESVLTKNIKDTNHAMHERDALIHRIQKSLRANRDVAYEGEYRSLMKQARRAINSEDPALELKKVGLELDKLNTKDKRNLQTEQERKKVLQDKRKLRRELNKLEKALPSNDRESRLKKSLIENTKLMIANIRTVEDLEEAQKRLDMVKDTKHLDETNRKAKEKLEDLKQLGKSLQHHGFDLTKYNNTIKRLEKERFLNLPDIDKELTRYTRMLKGKEVEIKNTAREISKGIDISTKFGGSQEIGNTFGNILANRDSVIGKNEMKGIQSYISQIEKAKVSTMHFEKDAVTPTGEVMKVLNSTFESTGKYAKQARYGIVQMADGTNQMRLISEKMVFNANRNLGVFEQLRIAMARVPVWMGAMTAFYGTIHSVQAMSREIIAVDTALTQIARVSGDHINLDSVFQGAVDLSKELGNNIHDIMASLSEYARTFGDFNERQLLAITKTATLMSNVSELSAQEATESLVGTMNAFNMTAEDSIQIVDALNEVKNNQLPYIVICM